MKPLIIVLSTIGVLLLIWHIRGYFTSRVEKPAMNLQEKYKDTPQLKIVTMPSQIVATVITQGSLSSSSSTAFGTLA